MRPAAQLMFSVAFLILSIFKLRHDKLNGNPTTAAYVIMAVSIAATILFTLITVNLNNPIFKPETKILPRPTAINHLPNKKIPYF